MFAPPPPNKYSPASIDCLFSFTFVIFCLFQLTYGITEKESGRKKGKLEFTASVKTRVKEYIRQYMKKIGPVYRKISSPQDTA
jgi:hypothetical protein